MEDECDLSNYAISNDLEWPLTEPRFQGHDILNVK